MGLVVLYLTMVSFFSEFFSEFFFLFLEEVRVDDDNV